MNSITFSVSDGVKDGENVIDLLSLILPKEYIMTKQNVMEMSSALYLHIEREYIECGLFNINKLRDELKMIFGEDSDVIVLFKEEDMTFEFMESFFTEIERDMCIEMTLVINEGMINEVWKNKILDNDMLEFLEENELCK
jgi:hypothetical protein